MPLYDYECEGGHRFEELHSIAERDNVNCPDCEMPAHIKLSACARILIAGWDTVVGHDGAILSRKQSTEEIPMLPEKVHGSRF